MKKGTKKSFSIFKKSRPASESVEGKMDVLAKEEKQQ